MILILDYDFKTSAEYLDDKSLIKQIKMIAEVLASTHYWYGCLPHHFKIQIPKHGTRYKYWRRWCRRSKGNFIWLANHGIASCSEYEYRFGIIGAANKDYRFFEMIWHSKANIPLMPEEHDGLLGFTSTIPLIMPKQYIAKHPKPEDCEKNWLHNWVMVESYRNYYKAKLAEIDNCDCPRCKGMLPFHWNEWTRRTSPRF